MKFMATYFLIALTAAKAEAAVISKGANSTLIIERSEEDVVFKIEPNKDLSISPDAPWSVKLTNITNLSPKAVTLAKKDFDPTIPGFKIALEIHPDKNKAKLPEPKAAKKGDKKSNASSFDYNLTAFICTIDKTKCFRDVIKGRADL